MWNIDLLQVTSCLAASQMKANFLLAASGDPSESTKNAEEAASVMWWYMYADSLAG